VTVVGTVTGTILLERSTVIPPDPAGCNNVTVQVAAAPELKLLGVHANELKVTAAGKISEAVCVAPLKVAERTTVWPGEPVPTVTLNVALPAPAEIVTLAGATTALELLLTAITAPPAPASCGRDTVQVTEAPAVTCAEVQASEVSAVAAIYSYAPMLGVLALVAPEISVLGAPLARPAPIAGDPGSSRKLNMFGVVE